MGLGKIGATSTCETGWKVPRLWGNGLREACHIPPEQKVTAHVEQHPRVRDLWTGVPQPCDSRRVWHSSGYLLSREGLDTAVHLTQ